MAYYPLIWRNCCTQQCPHYYLRNGKFYCQSKDFHYWLYRYLQRELNQYREENAKEYPDFAEYNGKVFDAVGDFFLFLEKPPYKVTACPIYTDMKAQAAAADEAAQKAKELELQAAREKAENERLAALDAERKYKEDRGQLDQDTADRLARETEKAKTEQERLRAEELRMLADEQRQLELREARENEEKESRERAEHERLLELQQVENLEKQRIAEETKRLAEEKWAQEQTETEKKEKREAEEEAARKADAEAKQRRLEQEAEDQYNPSAVDTDDGEKIHKDPDVPFWKKWFKK